MAAGMSSQERVARAMRSGFRPGSPLPDRVPVFSQLSVGHYFLQAGLDPIDIWFRSEGYAEALVRLARRYGFDGILVNVPGRHPEFDLRVERIERGEEEHVVRFKDGTRTIVPKAGNPRVVGPGEERVPPRFEDVDPERLYYVEPWDLAAISHPFVWAFEEGPRPPGDYFPPHHFDTLDLVLDRVGGRLSVHAEVFSPFSQFFELLGAEGALFALADDPGKARACLERLAAGAADLALRQAARGVDAVLVSSAFAGAGFISRASYREFVRPYEEGLIRAVRERHPDLPVYTHTCGRIGDRLDLLLETGTLGIDTLDPPPLGTVDLSEAKRVLAGRAFIKGNLDPVNTLLRGDVERVRAEARERLRAGKPGGGYILSSACSVAPATPPENLEVLRAVGEEEGRYGED